MITIFLFLSVQYASYKKDLKMPILDPPNMNVLSQMRFIVYSWVRKYHQTSIPIDIINTIIIFTHHRVFEIEHNNRCKIPKDCKCIPFMKHVRNYKLSPAELKETPHVPRYYGSAPDYDWSFRIVVIGDGCVGKSSILLRMTGSGQKNNFGFMRLEFDGMKLEVSLAEPDTRFFGEDYRYLEYATGIIMVYDVTNRDSFGNIKKIYNKWVDEGKEEGSYIHKMIIGNKIDLNGERVVKSQEAVDLCDELGIIDYLETSAETGANTEDIIKIWWNGIWNFASHHHKRKRYPFYECPNLAEFVFERTRKQPIAFS